MKNNYLVSIRAYIDCKEKLNIFLEHLKILKEENIDVSVSINTDLYLDEISKYVKYLNYTSDNEFIETKDYLEHAELVPINFYKNGRQHTWMIHGDENFSMKVSHNICWGPHSRPAFNLFKIQCNSAKQNGYKWCVLSHWHIPPPIGGYKKFFDEIIQKLEKQNAHAYVFNEPNGTDAIWGGIIVCDTKIADSKLLNGDWILSKRKYIEEWSMNYYEYSILRTLKECFGNDIIHDDIISASSKFWNLDDFNQIQKSPFVKDKKKRFINNAITELIHVYPIKKDKKYELILHAISHIPSDNIIKSLQIKYDDLLVLNIDEYKFCNGCWYIQNLPDYTDTKIISLSYFVDAGEDYEKYEEFFYTKDIDVIYNNIMKIEFLTN